MSVFASAELRRDVTGERAVECRRERLGIKVLRELVHASLVPSDEIDLPCEYCCRVFAGGAPDSQRLDRSLLGRSEVADACEIARFDESGPPLPSWHNQLVGNRAGEPVVVLGFSHHAGVQAGQRAGAQCTPATTKIVVGGREQQVLGGIRESLCECVGCSDRRCTCGEDLMQRLRISAFACEGQRLIAQSSPLDVIGGGGEFGCEDGENARLGGCRGCDVGRPSQRRDALGIGSSGRGLDLSCGGERGTPEEILVVEMVCEASRGGGRSAMCGVAGEVLDLSEPNEYFTFARQ